MLHFLIITIRLLQTDVFIKSADTSNVYITLKDSPVDPKFPALPSSPPKINTMQHENKNLLKTPSLNLPVEQTSGINLPTEHAPRCWPAHHSRGS